MGKWLTLKIKFFSFLGIILLAHGFMHLSLVWPNTKPYVETKSDLTSRWSYDLLLFSSSTDAKCQKPPNQICYIFP